MKRAKLLKNRSGVKIGVLALQGAFIEHIYILERLGVEAVEVRLPAELKNLDGLIIPGGESTTMLNLMDSYGLEEPLKELARAEVPILGICAGLICLARGVHNSNHLTVKTLSLMDIEVKRNAFGRQVDSFEVGLEIPALGKEPFPGVFIRAPIIEKVGGGVEALAKLPDGTVVAARQGKLLAASFHPELTEDTRFHHYFVKMASG